MSKLRAIRPLLKQLFWGLLAIATLVIILVAVWLWQLRAELTERLATQRFLPPTEYWSAPQVFELAGSPKKAGVVAELLRRGYVSQNWGDHLRAGRYQLGAIDACRASADLAGLSSDTSQAMSSCLIFLEKASPDPDAIPRTRQILVFDELDSVMEILSGPALAPTKEWVLEPELLAQYRGQDPILLSFTPLGEIPTACLNAVLSIEDSRYLSHAGISWAGIARAIFANLAGGRFAQGGSTITQQMVKNYFLTPEKTLRRKIKEFGMAILLEGLISKDQILETYLNIIYLGQRGPFQVLGFPAAAQHYFAKPVQELEIGECALLAAVLNNPGMYNPSRQPKRAMDRRTLVLRKMQELGFITTEQQNIANQLPLPRDSGQTLSESAPYFFDAVRSELSANGISLEGARVFTSLQKSTQAAAQQAVQSFLTQSRSTKAGDEKTSVAGLEAALLAIDNKTGMVAAIVGGSDFRRTQFNRAWTANRQVGSLMKPVVFWSALTNAPDRWSPEVMVEDGPLEIRYDKQIWKPQNYSKKFAGVVSMQTALTESLNTATARIGMDVGLSRVIESARELGATSPMEEVPSLLLGSFEMPPKEVAEIYLNLHRTPLPHLQLTTVRGVLGNESKDFIRTSAWKKNVEAQRLMASSQLEPSSPKQIAGEKLRTMMRETVVSGTGKSIHFAENEIPHLATATGKTGTTSDYRDAWFAGSTEQQTVVVWVGFDNNRPTGFSGASGALPIWIDYFRRLQAEATK